MFLVCDLETTSANVNNAQILTGTFLAVDKDLKLLAEKRIKCKPRRWDSEADQASNIHGITKDMVINWPSFFEILPDLFQWLETYDLKHFVCHSKRDMFGKKTTFDHAVIRLNLFPSDYYWKFVNMFNERNIISTHSLAVYLDNIYNFTKKDLKSIASALGIALDNHHDDREDAIACYEILKKLFPKINLTDFINKDYYHIGVLMLKDFIKKQSYIGSMFADEEGCGWTYLGQATSGKAMCRMDNSSIIQELSLDTIIKWVF